VQEIQLNNRHIIIVYRALEALLCNSLP